MSNTQEHFHGSDIEKIENIYKIKKEDIVNFAANVNPLGISPKLKSGLSENIDAIMTYPDRDYTSLRKAIGIYTNANIENIIVGNGSTELISLLIQIIAPKKALIIAPTYSEYAREVSLGGGESTYHILDESNHYKLNLTSLERDLKNDIDMLILCNPNNPTSSSITRQEISKVLDLCKEYNIFVMIDETYVEFADDMEDITSIPLTTEYQNLIVLRGVSKFFASPGLRLGYAIAHEEVIVEIKKRKTPWSINSLAAIAGEIMFNDHDYINQTKALISTERKRITSFLDKITEIQYFEPSANFILIKTLDSSINSFYLFEKAIQNGLMIRNCSSFESLSDRYIRFCIMMPEQNDKLLNILFSSYFN